MTTLPFNIEKSAFRKGEYVGYAAGYVFRIVKTNSSFGNWHAQLARFNPVNPRLSSRIFYGFTLAQLGERLEDFSKEIEKIAIVEIPSA